jgi:glycosyltransferase involved in cell wall biosynthesis
MCCGPRVTFVGHDASRTGAPIVLRSLLRWAAEHAEGQTRLVLRRGGPLVGDYVAITPVVVLERASVDLVEGARRGTAAMGRPMAALSGIERRLVRRVARVADPCDVVVANTLAALPPAAHLARATPLVCHVHELDHVAARVLHGTDRSLLDRVDHFVATGAAVRRMLVERWNVAEDRVTTVDAFVDEPSVDPSAVRAASVRMGGTNRPVVLSVGGLSHRKGHDRFVDLMALLADHPRRPVGVWLGGQVDSVGAAELRSDVARAGLEESVVLIESVDDPLPFVTAADVVVSTAREDPFPLSLLEAAALGRPVVSFDSGGLSQMLLTDGGNPAVQMGDSLAMATAVERLLAEPATAHAEGARLARRVRTDRLTEHLAPVLWDVIAGVGHGHVVRR